MNWLFVCISYNNAWNSNAEFVHRILGHAIFLARILRWGEGNRRIYIFRRLFASRSAGLNCAEEGLKELPP